MKSGMFFKCPRTSTRFLCDCMLNNKYRNWASSEIVIHGAMLLFFVQTWACYHAHHWIAPETIDGLTVRLFLYVFPIIMSCIKRYPSIGHNDCSVKAFFNRTSLMHFVCSFWTFILFSWREAVFLVSVRVRLLSAKWFGWCSFWWSQKNRTWRLHVFHLRVPLWVSNFMCFSLILKRRKRPVVNLKKRQWRLSGSKLVGRAKVFCLFVSHCSAAVVRLQCVLAEKYFLRGVKRRRRSDKDQNKISAIVDQ